MKLAVNGGDPVREESIDFASPVIGQEEVDRVGDVLRSGWLTTGEQTAALESKVSDYVERGFGIATVNCTSALYLAFRALNVTGEVLTSPMTFASTVSSAKLAGASPRLVDVRPDTLTLDPEQLKEMVSRDTDAIVPVHYAGQAMDMDVVLDLAEEYDATVIEDAAHGLGAEYDGRSQGNLGDVGCFSFYATKPITTGEGGMAVTDNESVAKSMRELRIAGVDKDAWDRERSTRKDWFYDVKHVSAKFNMNEIQAAIGVEQMEKLDQFVEERRSIANELDAGIRDVEAVESLGVRDGDEHGRHLYPIFVDEMQIDGRRDEFERALNAEGVETSVHYIPIHHHTAFADLDTGSLETADRRHDQLLCLPIHPLMDDSDVSDVIAAVEKVARLLN